MVAIYLNALIRDAAAVDLVGMAAAHAPIFQRIARQEGCVISSRALGTVCTGLVDEGYDSKGFRIKAKTCDFGPMAGFVCRKPELNKKGAAHRDQQEEAHRHALGDTDHKGWRAGEQQICISDARLNWVRGHVAGVAPRPVGGAGDTLWGTVNERGVHLNYLLHRETHSGDRVWAMYETAEPLDTSPALRRAHWDVLAKRPLTALVNPYPAWPRGHYKNCVTGDYDLFAVWPRRAAYDPMGEDRRIAGMPVHAGMRDAQIGHWEDAKLGNISNRVHLVAQLVNSALPRPAGCVGTRDMLHHSDEAGRPGVTEIELPVIAFIPGPGGQDWIVAADNLLRMNVLAKLCDRLGFQVIVNAGWRAQLGNLGDAGDARGWLPPLDDPARAR